MSNTDVISHSSHFLPATLWIFTIYSPFPQKSSCKIIFSYAKLQLNLLLFSHSFFTKDFTSGDGSANNASLSGHFHIKGELNYESF